MKASYLKTAFATAGVMLMAVFLLITNLTFFAPKAMAEFYGKRGMHSFEYECYNRVYKDSDKIAEQFFMFNLSVARKAHSKTISYGEKVLNHSDFADFIRQTNDYNLNNASLPENMSELSRILLFGGKDRIVSRMIEAMAELGQKTAAFQFAYKIYLEESAKYPSYQTIFPLYSWIEIYGKAEAATLAATQGAPASPAEFEVELAAYFNSIFSDGRIEGETNTFYKNIMFYTKYKIAASLTRISDSNKQLYQAAQDNYLSRIN